MSRRTRLILGSCLLVIVAIFIYISCVPRFFWSSPYTFIILAGTGAPIAISGCFLLANSLHKIRRRNGIFLALGITFSVLSFICWSLSFSFLLEIYASTTYWHDVSDYSGDYTVLLYIIVGFLASVISGLISGLCAGMGIPAMSDIHFKNKNERD